MAAITIRRLDETTKRQLRLRAADHGRSMEEEAREILKAGLAAQESGEEFVAGIRAIFEPLGGADLPEFPRGQWPHREPPAFG